MRYAVLALIAMGWSVQAGVAAESLDAPFPVEWRGVPLAQAVQEMAGRLDLPYILDASVDDDAMARPVRLTAHYLNGRQAFRWTVRSVGLDAVFVDGAVVLSRPDRLPRSWRRPAAGAGDERWKAANAKQVDLDWQDAPLSRVTRDVAGLFNIDIVFEAKLAEDQGLVHLEGTSLTLPSILSSIAEQLHASARYEDGAIWVEASAASASQPSITQPAEAEPAVQEEQTLLVRGGLFSLKGQLADSQGLQRQFSQAGVACRVQPSSPAAGAAQVRGAVEARGGLVEVLEAGRMLGVWHWQAGEAGRAETPVLSIQILTGSGEGRHP